MAHQVRAVLNYQWQGQPQSLEFQEITKRHPEQTVKAVLRLNTLEERDKVYAALTDKSHEAALVVRRKVRVATPVTELSPADLDRWKQTVKLYPEEDTHVFQDSTTGIERLNGTVKTHQGDLPVMNPDDFPVDFLPVEASRSLLEMADIQGILKRPDSGSQVQELFALSLDRPCPNRKGSDTGASHPQHHRSQASECGN